MKKRAYYLDLVRVILTFLVFFQHSAISFGATGGWYYVSKDCVHGLFAALLSLLMGINQAFFMSLFFFISAYLMPYSFDKKGFKVFIVDRMKRLVIPLLLFTFVLNPLLVFWVYGRWYHIGFGPMWFVFTLIVFELSYALYRMLANKRISIKWKRPTTLGILVFIIISGAFAFILRLFCPTGKNVMWLQLGYFSLYIFMYALGIIANRNHWLDGLSVYRAMPWFSIAIFAGIPFFAYEFQKFSNQVNLFFGGWNLQALFYAYWEPIMCVGICFFLLAYAKAHFDRPNALVQTLSADSYAFYIIHPFFVVGMTFLAEMLPVSPFLRLLFVLVAGIPLCFLTAHGLRAITGKKWI